MSYHKDLSLEENLNLILLRHDTRTEINKFDPKSIEIRNQTIGRLIALYNRPRKNKGPLKGQKKLF